jgi:hypothetical protein
MELNTPLDVQFCGRKLPNRAVQFGRAKSGCHHRVQEIRPGNFTRLVWFVGVVEERGQDLQSAFADGQSRWMVGRVNG